MSGQADNEKSISADWYSLEVLRIYIEGHLNQIGSVRVKSKE